MTGPSREPAPLRWLLIDEYDLGLERVVAACHDVDGLFVDPPPEPDHETFTLRGCRPEGRLRAALDRDGTPFLGNMQVEPVDHPRHVAAGARPDPTDCCIAFLADVSVTRARPAPQGDGSLDLELSGLVDLRDDTGSTARQPDTGAYLITGDERWGTCTEVTGIYRERTQAPDQPVTLLGCRPEQPLLDALAALARPGAAAWRRHITASVLTVRADGALVGTSRALFGSVIGVRPSAHGDGLVDVSFDSGFGNPFPTGARGIWNRWHAGRPAEPNLWAGYDRALRHEWAGACLFHRLETRAPDRPAGRTYHLDGRFVTDVEGFYCAIGEAVNGPGGYFGWNLNALDDCLRGRWGAATPFRLVWHDAAVARASLVPGYDRRRRREAVTLDYLLGTLAEHGVEVDLR